MDPGRARSGVDQAPTGGPGPDPVPASLPRRSDRESAGATPAEDPDGALPPVPWHFKLLVGAVALYLGWRAVQGVDWVWRQF